MQERIHKLKPARSVAVILCLLSGSAVHAATGYPELDLGIARFAQDTGEQAVALLHTRNPANEHESMIRARALLNTGSQAEAIELLDRLIDGDDSGRQFYRAEAALLKSTVGDDPGSRKRLLELASEKGQGTVRQQALYQLAEMARADERRDRAGKILASMDPGYWAALGYMNIAADYSKRDLNPSRALISLRVAMAMADEDPDTKRGEALNAQMLVRAGLLAYESEDYDKAINFLEKVKLDSYSAPQGLYLHGLALSARGNQRDAMQSWHRARKYPLAFPGVAESWLGTGRGYDLTGYLGQAGEAYLSASVSYDSERATLRTLEDLIREKGAYKAVITDVGQIEAEWFLADSRALTQPRTAYLLRFMENAASQSAVERVSDLEGLMGLMNQQEHTLKVFRGVLRERLQDSFGPDSGLPDSFNERFSAVVARLSSLRDSSGYGSGLADEIRQLTITLSDLRDSAGRFTARTAQRNQKLGGLLATIDQALARLEKNRDRAENVLEKANAELDQRMLAYIQGEARRMIVALEKAEQQIAHLYEYLALQSLSGRTP